jgi:hypothetical protein
VYGVAHVPRVGTHVDGQSDFAQHVAGVWGDDAVAQDLALAPAWVTLADSGSTPSWSKRQDIGKPINALTPKLAMQHRTARRSSAPYGRC